MLLLMVLMMVWAGGGGGETRCRGRSCSVLLVLLVVVASLLSVDRPATARRDGGESEGVSAPTAVGPAAARHRGANGGAERVGAALAVQRRRCRAAADNNAALSARHLHVQVCVAVVWLVCNA